MKYTYLIVGSGLFGATFSHPCPTLIPSPEGREDSDD